MHDHEFTGVAFETEVSNAQLGVNQLTVNHHCSTAVASSNHHGRQEL